MADSIKRSRSELHCSNSSPNFLYTCLRPLRHLSLATSLSLATRCEVPIQLMHAYRLNYEACRSLSWVTLRCRPGALPKNAPIRAPFPPAALNTELGFHRGICGDNIQRRFSSSLLAPRNDAVPTAPAKSVAGEADEYVNEDELPDLAELQQFEAELLSEFEDELRQAAEEEQLDLEDHLEKEVEDEADSAAPVSQQQRHENIVDAILAKGTFETIEEAQDAVLRALEDKSSPQEALFTFFRAAQLPGYLESLPGNFIKTIMDAVKPDVLLLPYRGVHRDLHPSALRRYRHQPLERINAIYYELLELLLVQIQYSKQRPHSWMLKILLDIARVCGWDRQARIVFRSLKELPGHQVDLESYNHYLEALCWANAFSSEERFSLRVTPHTIAERDTITGTRTIGYRTGEGGLKDEVLTAFKELQNEGLTPDATSYANLMIALAREGQMEDVKWVLNNVWDVDCDKVLQGHDEELLLENSLHIDSPIYPGSDTLLAVAHAFSINNDLSAAVRVVDFLATKYNLKISSQTWLELLEWSHVLSSRRGRLNKKTRHAKRGQLPYTAVMDLWSIMRSPPYEAKLTMPMIQFLVKACVRRDARVEIVRLMLEGDRLARNSVYLWKEFRRNKHKISSHSDIMEDVQRLQVFRDNTLMIKFLRLLLASSDERRIRKARSPGFQAIRSEWFHRTIPDIIGRFWRYKTPSGNAYDFPRGRLQLHPWDAVICLKPTEAVLNGKTVLQNALHKDIGIYKGHTRQVRLQLRHANRSDGGRPPKWTPSYHETLDVKDWGKPINDLLHEKIIGKSEAVHEDTQIERR